jgi:hypothetical protein
MDSMPFSSPVTPMPGNLEPTKPPVIQQSSSFTPAPPPSNSSNAPWMKIFMGIVPLFVFVVTGIISFSIINNKQQTLTYQSKAAEPMIIPTRQPIVVTNSNPATPFSLEKKSGYLMLRDQTSQFKDLAITEDPLVEIAPEAYINPMGSYVVVSGNNIYQARSQFIPKNAIVYSVKLNKIDQRINGNFCLTESPIFWKNFIIYESCDTFSNRPWTNQVSPGIVALNITSGSQKYLFESSKKSQFQIVKIQNDNLFVKESAVIQDGDWSVSSMNPTETEKTYKLYTLK